MRHAGGRVEVDRVDAQTRQLIREPERAPSGVRSDLDQSPRLQCGQQQRIDGQIEGVLQQGKVAIAIRHCPLLNLHQQVIRDVRHDAASISAKCALAARISSRFVPSKRLAARSIKDIFSSKVRLATVSLRRTDAGIFFVLRKTTELTSVSHTYSK